MKSVSVIVPPCCELEVELTAAVLICKLSAQAGLQIPSGLVEEAWKRGLILAPGFVASDNRSLTAPLLKRP
jgi:hypothetical protein